MPCNDVTERISVTVAPEDTLRDYRFHKRTCGQGVGADQLLIDELRGLSVERLLTYEAQEYLDAHAFDECIEPELEEFLSLKHLFAVQSALEVLTGKEPGGPKDACAAARVSFLEDGALVIEAQIAVDLMTDKIKSCGNCSGCGKAKKEKMVFH